MQDVQATLPVGSVIRDRYVVEDLLGKGGFGAVYLVSDRRVKGNLFALKEVTNPSKQEQARFEFECNVLRKLDYPALPRVYYVFENERLSRAYMLMDYIDGPNLEVLRLQQPQKRFPLQKALNMMAPIMGAVSYLHQQRLPIIHRDIKPANIIVPVGSDETMLVDFGIAKEYDQDSTTTAVRRCSPGYGAPEQYASGTNPGTDIYGLGATFYALLAGNIPTDALYRMTQLSSKHADPLEPVNLFVPTIPAAVGQVIERAMSIESQGRYATVEEFWQALQAAANWRPASAPVTPLPAVMAASGSSTTSVVTAPTAPMQPAIARKRSRKIIPAALALLAVIALVVGIGFGAGLFHVGSSRATPAGGVTSTAGVKQTSAATATARRSTPTPTPGVTATPTSHPTQTPAPSYPLLTSTYAGQIHNTPANVDSTMSLTSIKQSNANISGTLVLGSGLLGGGPWSGTVSTDKKIQFLVQSSNVAPLFFTGTIQSNGSMSGSYCSVDAGTHCNVNAGGYGTWNVAPVSGGSISPSTGISVATTPTSGQGDEGSGGNGGGNGKGKGKGHKK